MENPTSVPILFPFEPEQFWQQMRMIVREEMAKQRSENGKNNANRFETPGLTYKPLYKIHEICEFFQVSRPTLYQWIKEGKLKPYKIKSRVYFLHADIQSLLQPKEAC